MNLKISIKSQILALRELIIVSIIYFGTMSFLYLKTDFDVFKILFFSTICFYFLVILLPVVILHINYLNNNSFKDISVYKNKLVIGNKEYHAENIQSITLYATHQHFNNSVGAFSFAYNDYYYYVEITLQNSSEKIILTSLLGYKLDKILRENFESVKTIEHMGGFFSLLIK